MNLHGGQTTKFPDGVNVLLAKKLVHSRAPRNRYQLIDDGCNRVATSYQIREDWIL